MKKKDKELLLKDLCARLPYGVKCYPVITNGEPNIIGGYCEVFDDFYIREVGGWFPFSMIKPYLRSMSSMTEKEFDKYEKLEEAGDFEHLSLPLLDWFLKNHFDYRGLIEKGLAIEVTEENNPYNTAFKIVC